MGSSLDRTTAVSLLLCSLFLWMVAPNGAYGQFAGLREINKVLAPPARVLALTGGTLIDGRGGPVVQESVIVIRDNRIEAVGTSDTVKIPVEAQRIDVSGLAVLPGLLDAHFHIGASGNMSEIPELFLSHGVTTVRDPGRPIDVYHPIVAAGRPIPRLFLTGPHFDQSPPAWPKNAVILESPAEARAAVRQYIQQGASAIKVYFRLTLESIEATCEEADRHGIPVTAHLEIVAASAAIRAGLDGIEHITSFGLDVADPSVAERFQSAVVSDNDARHEGRYRLWATVDFKSPRVQKLLDLLVQEKTYISPTLATFERRSGGRNVSDAQVQGFKKMLKFVGICHQAGATVVTGSHTWSRHVELGWAYQREMELLVESGMTPLEVISASTLHNAQFFGCADRLGSIETGKTADLVLVKGRPHEDIRAMYDIAAVMLNGRFVAGEGFRAD